MFKDAPDSDAVLVSCEVCLKSIPAEQANSAETEDYVAYFCGLECYDLWKHQQAAKSDQQQKPAVFKQPGKS